MIAALFSFAVAVVPVDDVSVAGSVGVDEGAGAVFDVVAAAKPVFGGAFIPYVDANFGVRGPRLTVKGGLQLRHDVCPGFAIVGRGAVGGLVASSDAEFGATAGVDIDALFIFGGVVVFVGPAIDGAIAAKDGRVGLGGHGGVVVPIGDHVDVFVEGAGTYDVGGVFGADSAGGIATVADIGVRLRL